MASRPSSASKNAQQKRVLKSGGSGDSKSRQKRSAEPDTLVGRQQEPDSSVKQLVMDTEDGLSSPQGSRSSSRISLGSRSSSNLGQVPPRSESSVSQRIGTPTKQVFLTAVKRKQEVEGPIEPELDWRELTRSNSSLRFGGRSNSQTSFSQPVDAEDQNVAASSSSTSSVSQTRESGYSSKTDADGDLTQKMQPVALSSNEKEERPSGESSEEDEDSDTDEEARKAPNELFMEFLDCLMKKEYVTAEKLCRMILIYEPDNPEAQKFHPVILEKLQLEKEAEENGDEDDEDDDDDDEDESGDDEDGDEDDDSESEEDSSLGDTSEDEIDAIAVENGIVEETPPRPDSGIGM